MRLPFDIPKKKTLTIEALIEEALISGMRLNEIYLSTWGEIIAVVDAYTERKRREYQNLSIIADKQAYLTAVYLSGGGEKVSMFEMFPYWNEEETAELTIAKYKKMLMEMG